MFKWLNLIEIPSCDCLRCSKESTHTKGEADESPGPRGKLGSSELIETIVVDAPFLSNNVCRLISACQIQERRSGLIAKLVCSEG